MVQPLKHFALRLWATVLLGGSAILWLLPVLGLGLNPTYTLAPAAVVLLAVFFATGALFNAAGTRSIAGNMRTAEDWERSGSLPEAEAAYRRALSAYGSFLLSPRARRRILPELADHLARFYMARADQNAVSEAFIASHLQMHPEDEDVARVWLRQAGSRGWLERGDQDLAVRIGNAQPDSPVIQELLTRYCLMEERTDFFALETYRRMMTVAGEHPAAELVGRLAALFLEQGRADEWALPVYVRAFEQARQRQELAAGIAACLKRVGETQKNRRWLAAGRRLIKDTDPAMIEKMIDRFLAPEGPAEPPPEAERKSAAAAGLRIAGRTVKAAARSVSKGVLAAAHRLETGLRWVKSTPEARRWLRRGALIAVAAAAILLVINTVGYLVRSESRPEPHAAPAARATGRFTIQVAAYLKEGQARRYVEELKQQGLDVYWTETSGDQKKWYQVRISRFQDKAAARAYGDTLKARGLIDDYYIANYVPPAH